MQQSCDAPIFTIGGKKYTTFSGAEDPPAGSAGDQGAGAGTSGSTDDSGTSGAAGAGSGGTSTGTADVQAELAHLRTRMEAADRTAQEKVRELADVNAKLKAFEDKDKSELEKAQGEAKAAKDEATAAAEQLTALRIQNAFLTENTHTWHNPAAAMKLLDLDAVTIGDNGKVEGLKPAIDKLAKDHPYLIKTEEKGGAATGGASGAGGGSGTGGGHVIQDREKRFGTRLGGSR
jgi:hypothetical protein